jgi:hypothetical protein
VVQDTGRIDNVEGARLQSGLPKIGLDELHLGESEAARRRSAEQERGAREIGADHDAVRSSQVQTHLAGPAADLDDSCIPWDRVMNQAREDAAFRPRLQCLQSLARWIAGERRPLVKAAHRVGTIVHVRRSRK